jgi:hypothetical protein
VRARHGVSCVTWIHGLLGSTNLALFPFFLWELASWCKQAQSVFFFFLVFHLALVFLSLLAYNKLSILSFLKYRDSIASPRLGLCLSGCNGFLPTPTFEARWARVSSAAGGQVGHFNQRSLMQILTQFPIPKRVCWLQLLCF